MKNFDSLIDAIQYLKSEGFGIDFNIEKDELVFPTTEKRIPMSEVEVVHTYKIEADSDADYVSYIFGVTTADGDMGIFIEGEGNYSDSNFAIKKKA